MKIASVLRALAAALALVLVPSQALAAWHKAETDRFIVYGEGRESKVRDYAVKLTNFDQVLRVLHPDTQGRASATKVIVYLVDDKSDLRRIKPGLQKDIGGFYSAMNEGVFAVALTGSAWGGDEVMFHEYAHHFMLENFPAAYPAWFIEGFAEYFMTTEILPDGAKVGGYSPGRVYSIFGQSWLPMEDVITRSVAETRKERQQVFYAQAWLLMHYMRSDSKRAAQLNTAIRAIAKGEPPLEAFRDATGMEMAELTKALKGYKEIPVITFKNMQRKPPQVTVTRLPQSADDFMLDNLRLILAPTGQVDAEFLAGVRRRAAKYPGDALAETALARAEFVMGDVAAGEAIVKRRLDAAPDDVEMLLLAGTGQLMAGMRDKDKVVERYRAARPFLMRAYNLNKTDFRALYGYALSRSVEPVFPNDNDLNALLETRGLAPAVLESSLRAGLALLKRGDKARAAVVLAPVVNNPHGGGMAAQAKALLEGATPDNLEAATDDADGQAAAAS